MDLLARNHQAQTIGRGVKLAVCCTTAMPCYLLHHLEVVIYRVSRNIQFRDRYQTSKGFFLLVWSTASYAASMKQQSVLLFHGAASGKFHLQMKFGLLLYRVG